MVHYNRHVNFLEKSEANTKTQEHYLCCTIHAEKQNTTNSKPTQEKVIDENLEKKSFFFYNTDHFQKTDMMLAYWIALWRKDIG